MATSSTSIRRYEALDSLRGIAAITVAIYHYTNDDGNFRNFLFIAHGYRFVDFFFVLSGFIIYMRYGQMVAFAEQKVFLFKRLLRLYPLHFFTLVLFILFECVKFILYSQGIFKNKPFTTNSPETIVTNLLLLQGIVNSSKDFSWNYPSWSISVEMLNYLLFALINPLIARFRNAQRTILLLTIALLAQFLLVFFDVRPFKFVVSCTFGFFLGCVTLQLHKSLSVSKGKSLLLVNLVEIMAVTGMVLAICFLPSKYDEILPFIYSAVIVVVANELGVVCKLLQHRALIWLGSISYSLYMTHALVANVMKVLVLNILKFNANAFDLTVPFFVAVVIGLSYLTYTYIELGAPKLLNRIRAKYVIP